MDHTVSQVRSGYGLRIQSELELPELPLITGPPDICISSGSVELPSRECGTGEYTWGWGWCSLKRHIYGFSEVGRFDVEGGQSIIIDQMSGVDTALLRHILLGPVFASLLLQRGYLPLHANAIQIGDSVAGFIGPPGIGKSTLSAAMYARKHLLISDDILAVNNSELELTVPFGVPRIELYPEVASHLKLDTPSLDRIYNTSEKQSVIANSDPTEALHRLHAIYIIEDGPTMKINRVEPRMAIIQLLGHVYRPDVVSNTLGRQVLFQRCAELAARVPMYTLTRPRDLTQLPGVTTMIEEHIATHSTTGSKGTSPNPGRPPEGQTSS